MTRRFAALACVLLLVTAGCAGIGGRDDQTTTAPTQTTTHETTTESAEQLAPGVTADGVEDARALADAHGDILERSAFVREETTRLTNESATVRRNQTQWVHNESFWRLASSSDGIRLGFGVTNGTYGVYGDTERVLSRLVDGTTENVTYKVQATPVGDDRVIIPPADVFEDELVRLYDRGLVYTLAANADSVQRLEDGTGAVELSGTSPEVVTEFETTGDVEFTLTVTENGLVTSLHLTYDSEQGTVERSFSFDTDVTNPVEEPDWYETALDEAGLNETDA